MAKNASGKRPCSICRKWFKPDVRQVGRQNTCSPECRKESHRRQCKAWNGKNREYFKNNYLDKKLEQQHTSGGKNFITKSVNLPVLPGEIIEKHMGRQALIIIDYLVYQIVQQHKHGRSDFL